MKSEENKPYQWLDLQVVALFLLLTYNQNAKKHCMAGWVGHPYIWLLRNEEYIL